jgi:thiosulfate/3-mercaptopyruvate sulfurtransferase
MKHYNTLIEAAELRAIAGNEHLALLDCRFDLARPAWGEEQFAAGHLSGAHYLHLDRDLSSPITAKSGRHPLPDPNRLAQRLGELGVGNDSQVVLYDQGNGMYAARAWWLLRWLGHQRVAVLNGGLAAWLQAGGSLTTESATVSPKNFVARVGVGTVVTTTEVEQLRTKPSELLVDARAPDRFAGQNETIDPIAGHVPGAVNHAFAGNLTADGRFLSKDELRAAWLATLGRHAPSSVVAMCGSGVSACHNLLALEHAGLPGARLYAGSWSEWIRDPTRPVAPSQ